jgi:hypothetical protein
MKVLILCVHFAPETGAQALQASKVADALHEAGCSVRVLCGVPATTQSETPYPVQRIGRASERAAAGVFGRLGKRLRYELSSINAHSEWVRTMAREAAQIATAFEPDVVLTQSTPFAVHLIGLHFPAELKRKWVAYFSDLWPLALTPRPYRTTLSMLLKPLHMRVMKRIAKQARGFIFSNGVAVSRLTDALTPEGTPACAVVPHIGMPAPRVAPDPELVRRYAMRFVHVGKLTRERVCPELIGALRSIGNQWRERGFTGVTFVGDVAPSFRSACADLERSGLVDFVGEVVPATAQAISLAAKALVVIEAQMDESPFLASKFADYAMLEKPVLAICPPGPMRDLLAAHGGGIAVSHDRGQIVGAIDALLQGARGGGSEALIEQFASQRVASLYIRAFRRLL